MKIFYKTQEKIKGKMAFDKGVIHMKKETRTVVYDDELRMEAYRFEGIVQPFPSHFHEHYVIGFVENGERVLSCRDREYAIEEGSIVLFNPGIGFISLWHYPIKRNGFMCIGVCCKNITFFHSIVCLFRHSHITSYSPAFQVISVIRPMNY